MKIMATTLILIFNLFGISQLGISKWERQNILNKISSSISTEKIELYNSVRELYFERISTIKYDVSKITSIIKDNNFPEKYNFFEDTKVTKKIKDQGVCGSCWSIASATALSYRYNKIGVNVDLSPQLPLSCFITSCDLGATSVDAIYNLAKNGTVTYQCFPFSSAAGSIEKCPTECKDGSEFKRYYGKNGYTTYYDYSEENFYDIVTLIIYQLINYGPIVSSINVYKDFYETQSIKNCKNYIYSHEYVKNEESEGHAVVIVGYGYEQSVYYWLIQNSWGENYCDNGLVKIEFGQVGIEKVTFLQPKIDSNTTVVQEIPVTLKMNKDCSLEFTPGSYDDSNEGFESTAKNNGAGDSIFFQCCSISSTGEKKNNYIINRNYAGLYSKKKGTYTITEIQTLGTSNKYQINNNPFTFDYYGVDLIAPYFKDISFYVSESDSKIMLRHENIDDDFISKIYPNKNSNNYLKDCRPISLEENNAGFTQIFVCNIKSEELAYFENAGDDSDYYLYYDVLCGDREYIPTIVKRLDKSKYPVFKITSLVLKNESVIDPYENFKIKANIEGSLSQFNNEKNNSFVVNAEVTYKGVKKRYFGTCFLNNPTRIQTNFDMPCRFYGNNTINYDSITLSPYYYPRKKGDPFEIYISNSIKGVAIPEEFNEDSSNSGNEYDIIRRSDSNFIKIEFTLILLLLICL